MKNNKGLQISTVLIAVNFVLFSVKLYVGLAVSSLSIYTDAMNNLLDCVTGLVALAGFVILSKSKNNKYPFGFGRAEDMVSFVMSALIIVAGCSFAYSSLERIFYPTPVAYSMKYVYLICITAAVKLVLAFYLKKQTAVTQSDIIKSMYLDSLLDFFITVSVILSFTLSVYTGITTDGIVGFVISIMITVNGVKLLIPSVINLMGRRKDKICNEAKDFLSELSNDVVIKQIECHSYGRNNIFNALVSLKTCETDLTVIADEFEKHFSAEIYFRIK